MAVPTPPTAGEPIAEAWGDVVHDAVVAMDIQAGSISIAMGGSASAQLTVVFPRAFASAPIVMTNVGTGNRSFISGAAAASTTQFVFTMGTTDGGTNSSTIGGTWLAYGPRA
jgi:hypothetical protein